MSFSNINMLWLIWAVPIMLLACIWGFRKRNKILADYASEKGISAISPNISPLRRWLKAVLLLVVILLMAISLAGPQYGFSWKKIDRRGVDLIIALDCSRSMLAEDIQPSRLKRAKREVLDLLGMIQGDRVGLVAFAGTAFLQCPLTLDYEGFNLFLSALNPDFLPVGGTDLAGALTTAVSAFEMEEATDKAIILITDGEATGENPVAAAKAAAENGIKIFSIGIGAADGAPIPSADGGFIKDRDGNIVLSKLDEDTLKQMASVTSGAYVRSVAGDMDLDVIYQRYIRGTMKSAELGEQKTKVFENRYQWVLALALGLFVLELVLPEKKTAAIWMLAFLAVAATPREATASELKDALEQAQSAYASGDYDAAVQHFVTSQLEAPEKAEISYNLGNARYKSEDYDGAIQAYRQVLASEDKALNEKAHYNIGNAYYKKGNLDKAIESYETALSLDNSDKQARENLEFVKKIKENPPRQSPQDQQKKKDQDQKDQKNQENNKGGGKQHQSEDQAKNSPDQQQQNTENQNQQNGSGRENPQEQSSPPPEQKESQPPLQDESQQQSAGQNQTATPDEESLHQAEKMLNRLQDQPGRALMPAYRQRQVEKDW